MISTEQIERVVDDHSGGIKFTELLTHLQVSEEKERIDPEQVLEVISHSRRLMALTYYWRMGADIFREKHFVYTTGEE